MKVTWNRDTDDDGTHDLCGTFCGKYVDVIGSYTGKWSVLWANKRLRDDFNSRDDAKAWAEATNLQDYYLTYGSCID